MKKIYILIFSFMLISCAETQHDKISIPDTASTAETCPLWYNPVCGKVDVLIPGVETEARPLISQDELTFLNRCFFENYAEKREFLHEGVCTLDPRKFELLLWVEREVILKYKHYLIGAEGKDICETYMIDWWDGTIWKYPWKWTFCTLWSDASFQETKYTHTYSELWTYTVSLQVNSKTQEQIFSGSTIVTIQ